MTRRAPLLLAALCCAARFAGAQPSEVPAAQAPAAELLPDAAAESAPEPLVETPPDALTLVQRSQDALRAPGSIVEATLTIVTRRRERTLGLRIFDDERTDRALVRVLSPEPLAGTALLKLPPNLWLRSPGAGGTERVSAAGWSERFLDSDFTRADLVYGAADGARRTYRILGVDERAGDAEDRRAWQVESLPAEDAQGVAQGRIVTWVDLETAIPLRVDFHAPDGRLLRTLQTGDLRAVPGRPFPYPHRWVMRRSGKEGRESRIEVQSIRFDPAFEPGLFTTRHLSSAPR